MHNIHSAVSKDRILEEINAKNNTDRKISTHQGIADIKELLFIK